MKANYHSRTLIFKQPSGTSRGILRKKKTWYIIIENAKNKGIGECSPLTGLSRDDRPDYEEKLKEVCNDIQNYTDHNAGALRDWPSIQFGVEVAMYDLNQQETGILFPSDFTQGKSGIPINGLIWMGPPDFMKSQIKDLLERGFRCLKMKIGAINFQDELEILKGIRKEFTSQDLILRVDANGAFSTEDALEKLKILSCFDLHSIEQPIAAGQWEEMARLCAKTPLDIALDEELIPFAADKEKARLLRDIRPQYIILKPSLVGGFESSQSWIDIANELSIGWWITSALESNVGLNAISQWTYQIKAEGYQGLGTGSLYENNIGSPLKIKGEKLYYDPSLKWQLDGLF